MLSPARRFLRPIAVVVRRLHRWIDLFFGLALGTPLWIWSYYWPVQIQQLLVTRIGHLAIEPELFLSRRSASPPPPASVWFFAEGPVCNAALFGKWWQILAMGPACVLGPIYRASLNFRWLGLNPID